MCEADFELLTCLLTSFLLYEANKTIIKSTWGSVNVLLYDEVAIPPLIRLFIAKLCRESKMGNKILITVM